MIDGAALVRAAVGSRVPALCLGGSTGRDNGCEAALPLPVRTPHVSLAAVEL